MVVSIYDYVPLLVSKGNLRHRIDKLGCEEPEEQLNMAQVKLRRIAEQQMQQWWVVRKVYERPAYERPAWANGAFVYLSHDHAICWLTSSRYPGKGRQTIAVPQYAGWQAPVQAWYLKLTTVRSANICAWCSRKCGSTRVFNARYLFDTISIHRRYMFCISSKEFRYIVHHIGNTVAIELRYVGDRCVI